MTDVNRNAAGWKVAIAYALPNFGLAIMLGPVQGLLQGYYTKHFDIKIEQLASIFFLAPLLAAVADPVVGMISDRVRDRFWGRRSWLLGGVALSLLCVYHLFIVPKDLSVGYCRLWIIMAFIAWTVSEITYNAWGTELTNDYDSRTRIFSFKTALGFVGSTVFLALPNIIAYYQIHVQGIPKSDVTTEYSHQSMYVSFWLLAILVPLFIVVALWVCPGGSHVKKTERKGPVEVLCILFSNKAMLIFMGAFAVLGIAGGMQSAMAYLHLSTFLRLGEEASTIYTVGGLFFLLGVPVWNLVAAKTGKHVALMIGLFINIFLFVALGMLNPRDETSVLWGYPAVFWYYLLIFCGLNFSQVVYFSMSPAIVGDISDATMLETKEDQSATYFAVYTFVYKLAIGTGMSLAFYVAGKVFGFDPKKFVQTDDAALGIRTMMGFMPALLVAVAIGILVFYPISKAKYLEIQEKIKNLGMKVND